VREEEGADGSRKAETTEYDELPFHV